MINIIFDDNIDFYFARERVLERLTFASTFLPPGVTPYLAPDATALGQIFWYTVEGEGLRPRPSCARSRTGTSATSSTPCPAWPRWPRVGGFPSEYQIDVDPEKLRAYGVTLGELFAAVARSNSAVGGKVMQKGNAEYMVRGVGWIASTRRHPKTVVKPSRDGHADHRRHRRPPCSLGQRVPPQRAGEGRQRGGRRRS